MAHEAPARRGAYAKGVAKREEILARALDVIAREGYRGASVKELADAVGLSQAGLLHYFDSKEDLFTEILRKRDELDDARFGGEAVLTSDLASLRAGYLEVIRHNADVPGLVQLFSRMAVDAADPAHPAHEYFLERGRHVRAAFAAALDRPETAVLTARIGAEPLARILQAVADGLQLQFMLEPDLDMAATLATLFDALAGSVDAADVPEDRS